MALTPPGATGRREFRNGVPLGIAGAAPPDLRLVWIRDPEPAQLLALREEIGAEPARMLAGPLARQVRARIDRIGDASCVSLRPARYVDASEQVVFSSLQLLIRDELVVVIARGGCFPLDEWISEVSGHAELLAGGPTSLVQAAIRRVLDDYEPVLAGLANDIDEIEDQVFGSVTSPVRRIYELLREVISFQRATDPLGELLGTLERRRAATDLLHGGLHEHDHADAHEHGREPMRFTSGLAADARMTSERAAAYRSLLENVLNVNLALETKRLSEASIEQTEQAKKISSWAAILFTPSLIAGVYGMNFDHMPELHWALGYPFALCLMLALGVGLYAAFKRRDWI